MTLIAPFYMYIEMFSKQENIYSHIDTAKTSTVVYVYAIFFKKQEDRVEYRRVALCILLVFLYLFFSSVELE